MKRALLAAGLALATLRLPAQTSFRGTAVQNGQVLRFQNGVLQPGFPSIADVAGLQAALDGKAPSTHTHPVSALQASGALPGQALVWNGVQWAPAAPTVSWGSITGSLSSQADLAAALAGKAAQQHSHPASDIVSGIFDPARLGSGPAGSSRFLRGDSSWAAVQWQDLAGKPAAFPPEAHGHDIAAIAGLQEELNARIPAPPLSGAGGLFLRRSQDNTAWILGTVDWNDLANRPQTFPPASHGHGWQDLPAGLAPASMLGSGTPDASVFLRGDRSWQPVSWNSLTGRPTEFPPAAHSHAAEDIVSGLLAPARLGAGQASGATFLRGDGQWAPVGWSQIADRPSAFPPEAHQHAAADITAGILPPQRLGSGTPSSSVFLRGDGQWTNGLSGDLYLVGNLVAAQTAVGGVSIDVNVAGSGDRHGTLDLHAYGAPFEVDFAARLWRRPGTDGDLELWNLGSGAFRLLVNSTERVTVTGSGFVGIGTTSPTERLDVNGNVKATQFLGSLDWSNVANRPSTFPPSAHSHAAADISSGVIAPARLGAGTPSSANFLRGDGQWASVGWSDVTGKPSTFTPATHTHPPSEIQQAGAGTGQVLAWNGSQWAPATVSGGSSPTPFSSQSSNFTAASNTRYYLKANNITVTLPANPADGDWVELIGAVSGCAVARNGRNIMGLAEDMSLDTPYFALRLVFISSDNDWRIAP